MSLPVWAAWIEIISMVFLLFPVQCRCPYGQRGLKSLIAPQRTLSIESLPVWAAWIEITMHKIHTKKFSRCPYGQRGLKLLILTVYTYKKVAARMGSVD